MTDREELLELARDILEMQRAQRAYWDSGRTAAERSKSLLQRSQQLERALKAKAEAIVVPRSPSLFDEKGGAS